MDPLLVAIGSTTASVVSAGINIATTARNIELEKKMKRQRLELAGVELGMVAMLAESAFEHYYIGKKLKSMTAVYDAQIKSLEERVIALSERLNVAGIIR